MSVAQLWRRSQPIRGIELLDRGPLRTGRDGHRTFDGRVGKSDNGPADESPEVLQETQEDACLPWTTWLVRLFTGTGQLSLLCWAITIHGIDRWLYPTGWRAARNMCGCPGSGAPANGHSNAAHAFSRRTRCQIRRAGWGAWSDGAK